MSTICQAARARHPVRDDGVGPALHKRLGVQPADWREPDVARLSETAGFRRVFQPAARRSEVAGILERCRLRVGIQPKTRWSSVEWPSSLREISFGWNFNHPVRQSLAGNSLRYIKFGDSFNREIERVKWSSSVFGRSFNQCVEGTTWPSSLEQVKFGKSFDQRIATGGRRL